MATPHSEQPQVGPAVPPRLLTIEELAEATTFSVSTLRRLVRQGIVTAYQPGGPRHRLGFAADAVEQATRAIGGPAVTTSPAPEPRPVRSRGPRPKWTQHP
jgi:excisionase family DNA binding protein